MLIGIPLKSERFADWLKVSTSEWTRNPQGPRTNSLEVGKPALMTPVSARPLQETHHRAEEELTTRFQEGSMISPWNHYPLLV